MLAGRHLSSALSLITPVAVHAQMSRMVDFLALTAISPTEFLYTSGRANRFNPAGVYALYLANTRDTCIAEVHEDNPQFETDCPADVTYRVNVQIDRCLDLLDENTRAKLHLSETELFANWRRAKKPTATQKLGMTVAEGKDFSSIRYPSNPSRSKGADGWNIVIFQSGLSKGESVSIRSPDGKISETWP